MAGISAYTLSQNNGLGKKKKDLNLMVEAVAMVALKQKIDVKKKQWNSDQIIDFIKKNRNEVWEELRILERTQKVENEQKNVRKKN